MCTKNIYSLFLKKGTTWTQFELCALGILGPAHTKHPKLCFLCTNRIPFTTIIIFLPCNIEKKLPYVQNI